MKPHFPPFDAGIGLRRRRHGDRQRGDADKAEGGAAEARAILPRVPVVVQR